MRFPEAIESEVRRLTSAAGGRVRIGYPVWLRPFLQRSVLGITLGRTVYVSPRMLDRSEAAVRSLIRHELVHVRQVGELGLFRFLYRYVAEYCRLRRSGLSSSDAYRNISFEVEAYRAEEEPGIEE